MKYIREKIRKKGIMASQVAKMVEIDKATLSRIISGKQIYVSTEIIMKINTYLDALNTDDKNIFKKKSKNIDMDK